ncbi:MAG TPA: isochorismatase family protein [Phycisphaerae bacterium]|nr:isochorismatase family protein [Phycisphaerae bacterium]
MNTNGRRVALERILLDLNTQCDFLLPGGALPVSNRGEIMPRIRQLMNWARLHQTPVISSLEAHRSSETFRGLPPHCLDRTLGQKKLPFTLMPSRLLLMGDNTSDLPIEPFRKFQQIIFTKRNADFLSNPKADRLINSISPGYWIIFGITATHCVKAVTLGLLARHHKIVVVRDACGYWSAADGEHAFRQMEAKGAMLVATEDVLNGTVAERVKSHKVHISIDDDEVVDSLALSWSRFGEDGRDMPAYRRDGVSVQNSHSPDAEIHAAGNGNGSRNGNGNGHAAGRDDDTKKHSVSGNGHNGTGGKTLPTAQPKKESPLSAERAQKQISPATARRKSRPPNPTTRQRRGLA